MGQGNAGVRRRRDGGADARDDLEWYAGGREGLGLLAAATEHERVAALEPHHAAAAPGVHHEQRVDPLLRQRVIAAGLAGKDAARARRFGEQPRIDEPVIDDDLRPPQQRKPANGHEAGIAGPRPDESDHAYAHAATFSRARSRRAASSDGAPSSNASRPASSAASQSAAPARRPAARSSRRASAATSASGPYASGSDTSIRWRTARASAGLAPPVETATVTAPRRTTAGRFASQCAGTSAAL